MVFDLFVQTLLFPVFLIMEVWGAIKESCATWWHAVKWTVRERGGK